ncbi:MAG TPA: L-glyceraldehyde 3-phosphate reductase [Rhodothermales bacterium]
MSYSPAEDRYDGMIYRRVGRSGLKLPAISLGLWYNFGGVDTLENQRAMLRRAFDLGITHFDLANNYGPPPGSAEENFGRILRSDFRSHRDELIISTKAGWLMWPGPYGIGSTRKYLLSSLDQSLQRMGLDYVDIFYSHRYDPETPIEETVLALDQAVRSGKALYVGISSYPPAETREAARILRELRTPLIIHQPYYNMFGREIEHGLLQTLADEGLGCIVFSPLAQGMLTDKYLKGIPPESRIARGMPSVNESDVSPQRLAAITRLNDIARQRGQSLAQMAVAWVLRHEGMTSALVGTSSIKQVEDNVAALRRLDFDPSELAAIDAALAHERSA